MSERLVKNLIIVLVVLAAGYAIVRFAAGRAGSPPASPIDLAAVAEAGIDSVIVVSSDETVRVRGGDEWTVNGYEAVPESGDALERALEESHVLSLVSRNPENHSRLGVADRQGYRMTIYAGGGERLDLIVSEKGQSWDDAYVRQPGADEVYLLRGNLVDLARRDVEGWRNRQIVSAAADEVERLEFVYPDAEFNAARDSAGWTLEPSGARAKAEEIERIVREVASLRAVGFAPDSVADTLSWESPAARIRALGPGGARLAELSFLARETSGYYVRRPDKPVVFTLSQYSGDQVLKRESDLAEAEAEAEAEASPAEAPDSEARPSNAGE